VKILQIAGSVTIGTNAMGPASNDIFQLAVQFEKLGHEVTIADTKTSANRENLPSEIRLIEVDNKPRTTLVPKHANNKSPMKPMNKILLRCLN
jgi:hypothetical protein